MKLGTTMRWMIPRGEASRVSASVRRNPCSADSWEAMPLECPSSLLGGSDDRGYGTNVPRMLLWSSRLVKSNEWQRGSS